MQQMAQGLASLGRGQDSMLVHMTPGEVHGLQSLAMAHGGSLTINPKTGLPEAGFLSNILPMLAGAGLMAMGVPSPWMAAALVGGGTALMTKDLKKGFSAGLGAYGGAGIGESLAAAAPTMGLPAAGVAPAVATTGNMAADIGLQTASGNPFTSGLQTLGGQGGASLVQQEAINQTALNQAAAEAAGTGSKMLSGAEKVFSSPSNAFEFAKANKYPIAAAAAGPAMGMLGTQNTLPVGTGSTGPQNFANYAMKPMQYDPKTGKYSNATYSPVNYSPSYSPNMAYAAGGGSMQDIQANALGGTVPNENQFYPGANIARGGASYAPQAPSATDVIGGYDQSINQYTGEPMRMAGGGVTYNQADQTYSGEVQPYGSNYGSANLSDLFASTAFPKQLNFVLDEIGQGMRPQMQQQAAPKYNYNQDDQQYTQRMAGGGLASLDTYAAGGRLLQGPGDGMSDSIPAVIGGAKPQRAALAQGEFVVPADVVSHLGNGSTDAGSKRLYAMMDKVRHARTGSKKQGRQINPAKFMPA